ncbi:MAG TPA: nucleotidyltransferase domain-containing protein [Syntrophales bacterium]|nr:nucleotidyltransferase domain-containing protein [Syntrophales bacterium]
MCLRKEKLRAISKIAEEFSLADIYAFGSNAKDVLFFIQGETEALNVPPSSDVDIGVRPEHRKYLSAKQKVELMIFLEDLLDVSRVDLVNLHEADPFLALEIIRGELLYTKDADDQAEYEIFVLRRAADLIPYKKERERMAFEGDL